MPLYRTSGVLTGTIEPENVAAAQAYLHDDDMAEYVSANAKLEGVLEWIVWDLANDGHHWTVTAVTTRELDDDELKRLSSEVRGQNSDGLGESFEQQDFAWNEDPYRDQDCYACGGNGYQGDDECGECGGAGFVEHDDGHMVSFDWKTNPCTFERIK